MTEHFFIVGAQRSGTTYLYSLLASHPEIEMAKPLRPEPKFFLKDTLFANGLVYYEQHFFSGKTGAWLRGEKSTSYLESVKAAYRIAQCFPKTKIIVVLRNPIERAISNYWFSVNSGLENMPIEQAFQCEGQRVSHYDREHISVSPYAYLARGRYIDYIAYYEQFFPAEHIKLIIFEQFAGLIEPVQAFYSFLGVDSNYIPPTLHQKKNVGNKPNTFLSPELRVYLEEYFAEPNKRLAQKFNLNLDTWGHPSGRQLQ